MESPIDVVVGRTYSVPCVTNEEERTLPIMLPAHIDGKENCLLETPLHYHIDFRFVKLPSKYAAWRADFCSKPFMKKMVAISSYCNSIESVDETAFFFINRWYRQNRTLKAKNRICPHRGTKITNQCGTCPAHGLIWDLDTESLANFIPPFYLQLINGNEKGPSGIITDQDTCEIKIEKRFKHNGTVIMVDSAGRRYGKGKQTITKRICNKGDVITFNTKQLCSPVS